MKTLNFRPEQGSDVSDRLECREEKNEKNSYYTVQRDCALYGSLTGKNDPLFDQGTRTTFYAETAAGHEPDISAENYFSGEDYDLSKFTFSMSGCNWEEKGIYQIPVFYDGKETNCVISLEVTGPAGDVPETKEGLNEDTRITN